MRLAPGVQARIICADAVVVVLQGGNGAESVPVPEWVALRHCPDPWANAVLSADDGRILQVITPRTTALLTTTPTIRWSAVEGTEIYTVILRRGEEVWRTKVRGTTMLNYPPDQPPLERRPMYRFFASRMPGLYSSNGCSIYL